MVHKSDTAADEFAGKLRMACGDRIRHIFLFGSRARGDYRPDSDYDLLIIVDSRDRDLLSSIRKTEWSMLDAHDTLFSSVVYDISEWERKKHFPLGVNVIREGVPL